MPQGLGRDKCGQGDPFPQWSPACGLCSQGLSRVATASWCYLLLGTAPGKSHLPGQVWVAFRLFRFGQKHFQALQQGTYKAINTPFMVGGRGGVGGQRTILGSQFSLSWDVGIKSRLEAETASVFNSHLALPASLRPGTKETAPPGTGCVAMESPKSIIALTGHWGLFALVVKRVLLLHLLKESETLDSTPSRGLVLLSSVCLSVLSILRQFN